MHLFDENWLKNKEKEWYAARHESMLHSVRIGSIFAFLVASLNCISAYFHPESYDWTNIAWYPCFMSLMLCFLYYFTVYKMKPTED